jgi:hypothetical protein
MNLRFWKKSNPAPGWTKRLSREEKRTLAANLRAILDPKRVIDPNRLDARSAPLR